MKAKHERHASNERVSHAPIEWIVMYEYHDTNHADPYGFTIWGTSERHALDGFLEVFTAKWRPKVVIRALQRVERPIVQRREEFNAVRLIALANRRAGIGII